MTKYLIIAMLCCLSLAGCDNRGEGCASTFSVCGPA